MKNITKYLIGAGALGAFAYLFIQNNIPVKSEYEINSKKLPKDFDGLKIAQLSDIHSTKSAVLKNILLKQLRNEKPDYIFITGDLVDARRMNIEDTFEFVEKLLKIAPVYYVVGNHESAMKRRFFFLQSLYDSGVKILNNKCEKINFKGIDINIVGIEDPIKICGRTTDYQDIIKETIDEINFDKNNFTVLLSHRPEIIKIYNRCNIDLAFTGHAHGGQARLPIGKFYDNSLQGWAGLYAPNQGKFPKFSGGLYKFLNTKMIVNRGIGNSSFPFRINNRPELVICKIKGEV